MFTSKRISDAIVPATRQCSGTPSAAATTSADWIDTLPAVRPRTSRQAVCGFTVALEKFSGDFAASTKLERFWATAGVASASAVSAAAMTDADLRRGIRASSFPDCPSGAADSSRRAAAG